MNYDILLTFVLATAALAISPGPDNIFVLIQSMTNGKKYGVATVAGLMTGCLVHATLLAFGVSAVIRQNPNLFFVIKLFGAIYLFYLAFKVFKSSDDLEISNDSVAKKSLGALYKQGFIMNVLNPKVTIFFLAFFPGFLFSDAINIVIQFYVLAAIFIVVSFTIFSAIAMLSGTISKYIRENRQLGKILKWLQIIVFVGIGVYLLLSDK
ncbi:LysE family translocator [Arenibacter sp. BSSL-BM3]|uniref:LysE family translocator n=1 Tax=Arenibacter arenosicollis TaxID=2762274 RepID=A0ABR7QPQ8_9FLAO|nr:LysE family translocator [Arenibacter arenosicollis]MBC8769024.1 LysE family translocator [Arenibacter arenosicollis]